jgi:hypothetical protein
LPTARIPLSAFAGADLSSVRAVRLIFDEPYPSGAGVFVSNIRATRLTTPALPPPAFREIGPIAGEPGRASSAPSALGQRRAVGEPTRITAGNAILSIEDRGAEGVDITLASARFFEPGGSNLVLSIGGEKSNRESFPNGNLYRVRFTLPRGAWNRVKAGDRVQIDYGRSSSVVWQFGALDRH